MQPISTHNALMKELYHEQGPKKLHVSTANRVWSWLHSSWIKLRCGFRAEKIAAHVSELLNKGLFNPYELRWFSGKQLDAIAKKTAGNAPPNFEEFIKQAVCFAHKDSTQRKILHLLGQTGCNNLYLKYLKKEVSTSTFPDTSKAVQQKLATFEGNPLTKEFKEEFQLFCAQGLEEKKFDELEAVFKQLEALNFGIPHTRTAKSATQGIKTAIRESRKAIKALQEFQTSAQHKDSMINGKYITEKEWNALLLFMKKLKTPRVRLTDEQKSLLKHFLSNLYDNTNFNEWAKAYIQSNTVPNIITKDLEGFFKKAITELSTFEYKSRQGNLKNAEKTLIVATKIVEIATKKRALNKIQERLAHYKTAPDLAIAYKSATHQELELQFNHLKDNPNFSQLIAQKLEEQKKEGEAILSNFKAQHQNNISELEQKEELLTKEIADLQKDLPEGKTTLTLAEVRTLLSSLRASYTIYSISGSFGMNIALKNGRAQKLIEIGEKANVLLEIIHDIADSERAHESAHLGFSSVNKMNALNPDLNPSIKVYANIATLPFWHTLVEDFSEGELAQSHQIESYTYDISDVETDLTHDRYALSPFKIATTAGKAALKELFNEEKMTDAELQEVSAFKKPDKNLNDDEILSQIVQEEFALAFDEVISGEAHNLENSILDPSIQVPYNSFNSLEDVEKWLTNKNKDLQSKGKKPITIDQVLAPIPEIDLIPSELTGKRKTQAEIEKTKKVIKQKELIEDTKHDLRLEKRAQLFAGMTNSHKARLDAYKQSWLFIRPLKPFMEWFGKKIDPDAMKMEGSKICAQFGYLITCRALQRMEHTMKGRLVTMYQKREKLTLDQAVAKVEKLQLFALPILTEAKFKAMTSEMVALDFKDFITPLPMPQIYRDLIEADESYFSTPPITHSSATMFTALGALCGELLSKKTKTVK